MNPWPDRLLRVSDPHQLHYDVERVRADFPVLATTVRGKRLAFLDTAASAQRPEPVIDAVSRL